MTLLNSAIVGIGAGAETTTWMAFGSGSIIHFPRTEDASGADPRNVQTNLTLSRIAHTR